MYYAPNTNNFFLFFLLLSLSTCWANKRHVNYTVCAADENYYYKFFKFTHLNHFFIQFKQSERCTHRTSAPCHCYYYLFLNALSNVVWMCSGGRYDYYFWFDGIFLLFSVLSECEMRPFLFHSTANESRPVSVWRTPNLCMFDAVRVNGMYETGDCQDRYEKYIQRFIDANYVCAAQTRDILFFTNRNRERREREKKTYIIMSN